MNHPFSLEGKTIVVTGASSGFGRQCAIICFFAMDWQSLAIYDFQTQ